MCHLTHLLLHAIALKNTRSRTARVHEEMPGQEHVPLVTLKDNFPAGWTEQHRSLQVRVLDKLFQHQASHGGDTISDEIVNMVHSAGILASYPEYNFHSPSSPVVDAPPPSTSSTHKPDSTSPILGAEGWDSAAGEKPPHDADGTEECPVPTPTSQCADVTHEERGGTPPSTTPPTEEAPSRVDGGPRIEDKHVAQDPLPSPAGNDNSTKPHPSNFGTPPAAECCRSPANLCAQTHTPSTSSTHTDSLDSASPGHGVEIHTSADGECLLRDEHISPEPAIANPNSQSAGATHEQGGGGHTSSPNCKGPHP